MKQLTATPPAYQLINTDIELAQLVEQCRQLSWVAIDTEFMRTNTYYPIIGLIQLATGDDYYLIDPLSIENPKPLADLLADTGVVKVMHACSEDMEVFQRYLGQLPVPLFDTQIAAAVLGFGFSAGYKTLVEKLYQVSLPKEQQRSDWLARPLSQQQLDYAVMDVVFLADIYQNQLETLQEQNRLIWVQEECENILKKCLIEIVPEQQYQRVKGAGTLTGEQLFVLRSLAAWRETEAIKRDMPRGFLLKDNAIVEIARSQPTTTKALSKVENIHPRVLRKDGQEILGIIAQAVERGGTLEVIDNFLPRDAKPLLKNMQTFIAKKADALEIPPELIMNRKTLSGCLLKALESGQFALPEKVSRWKSEQIEQGLIDIHSEYKAK